MGLKYVFDRSDLVVDFVVRTKRASGFAPRAGFTDSKLQTIGVLNGDDELIAGIVYFNYSPEAGTIEMSAEALPKQQWLTKTTLALMFYYPFVTCGCQMLITKTSARSAHVLRMLAAMDFAFILIPRAGGRNEDGVICLLTYEDWAAGKFFRRLQQLRPIDEKTGKAA